MVLYDNLGLVTYPSSLIQKLYQWIVITEGIRTEWIQRFRQGIRAHPPDDGRVVHTGSVVNEREGRVEGLLLLLAGVAPAVGGVRQGRYQGAAGNAPPGTEGEVVAGLHDCTRTGIGDCPYASQMVGDVMIDRVTRYRS